MADLPSVKKYINDIQVAANAPHSESLMVDIGGSVNYILDEETSLDGRITALEAVAPNTTVSAINVAGVPVNTILAGSSISLSGVTSGSVLISVSYLSLNTSTGGQLALRRGTTALQNLNLLTGSQYTGGFSFLDTAPGSAPSYNLYTVGAGISLTFNTGQISAHEVR